MPSAAAIYCRISSDPAGTGLGVKRQESDCRAWAERRGWTVTALYVDDDTSAYSGKPRPSYLAMLEAIKTGVVDAVVVYHLDRLHRHPKELEEFLDVCDASGVKDLATVTGDIDLATHDGRFHARILGAVARKESDDKSRRLQRKHLELAQQGSLSGGGTRPFGYDDDRVTVRDDEAALIREAAQRILAGETLRSVVVDWNRRGVPTVTGVPWTMMVLRRTLTAPRTCGWREHRGSFAAPAKWPAILDRDDVDRLRRILLDPSRRTNNAPHTPRYLLTGGLARCVLCDAALVARPRTDHARSYVCATGPGFKGCGRIRILAEPFEGWVTQAVFSVVATPGLEQAVESRQRNVAAREDDAVRSLATVEAQLRELAEDWASGSITRGEWLAARSVLNTRAETQRQALRSVERTAALSGYVGRTGVLESAWGGFDLGRRRSIVGAVVERVTVGPGRRGFNRFDPSRLDVVWRL